MLTSIFRKIQSSVQVYNFSRAYLFPFSLITQSAAELLRHDAAVAMKVAFGLLDTEYKTREASISDLRKFKKAEVSVTLCDDNFIQKLNKEWRDEDKATDVLSMSQHIPEIDLPIVSMRLKIFLPRLVFSFM